MLLTFSRTDDRERVRETEGEKGIAEGIMGQRPRPRPSDRRTSVAFRLAFDDMGSARAAKAG